MNKGKLGSVPFVSKFLAKRRLRLLGTKADKLKQKFDELGTEIKDAKEKAAGLLTKKEYDVQEQSIDTKIDGFCEIEGEAKERPKTKAPDIKKMCRESLAKKFGRGVQGPWTNPVQAKALDDCFKKGTGTP